MPAISAARIVGDHSMSRLSESCSFQRSTTPFAFGARGIVGNLPVGNYGNIESPRPHAHRGSIAESMRLIKWRNARSVGIRANHEGACRAFSTTLHIGVFARRGATIGVAA